MKIKAEVSRIFENRNDMLKAATNIILEDGKDSLVIKNVRIIEGKNGLFMSLPARRNVKNGCWIFLGVLSIIFDILNLIATIQLFV